jgi:E3 ubiquitin-protein ligase TRIP12
LRPEILGDNSPRLHKFVPIASFASSILSSKDHPSLVIGALQLVDLLLTKVPSEYKPTFRREGVFHEIEALATRDVASYKSKDKDKDSSDAPSPGDTGSAPAQTPTPASSAPTIPGFKKLTSLSLEPEDAITLRARVIRFKHLSSGDEEGGDNAFEKLRALVERLAAPNANEKSMTDALKELAELFASPRTSVSSFELLQSGVVDALLHFATDDARKGEHGLSRTFTI